MGLQGISTDSEPGAADIQQLADFVVQKKVRTLFVENSIPERTMQAVRYATKAQGWDVQIGDELYSDALGDPEGVAGTYPGMFTHNIHALVQGLQPTTSS